jgi:hypothetical protein
MRSPGTFITVRRREDAVDAETDVHSTGIVPEGQRASSLLFSLSDWAGETPACPTGKMPVLHRSVLGEHAQAECFHAGNGFIARGTVSYGTGNLRDLGNPPPIVLLLGFDRERHKDDIGSNGWVKDKRVDRALRARCFVSIARRSARST